MKHEVGQVGIQSEETQEVGTLGNARLGHPNFFPWVNSLCLTLQTPKVFKIFTLVRAPLVYLRIWTLKSSTSKVYSYFVGSP